MAYELKYIITSPTQGGTTSVINIYDNEFIGDPITYPGGAVLKYIPSDDNPLAPIVASTISVNMDVTDDPDNMPDLVTTDDRKFYVEWLINGELYWAGWVLSDNVTYSFITGGKVLSFDCVDGLGMLQDIPFPEPVSTNINEMRNMVYYIFQSLDTIDFPTNLSLFTLCSIYADGMDNRGYDPSADPLAQAYMPFTTFMNSEFEYINCLDVLKNILRSWGMQLRQANGAWYAYEVTELAAGPIPYTEYDENGDPVGGGEMDTITLITADGYDTNTRFINATQQKRILKGFNAVYTEHPILYAPNYFNNAKFKDYSVDTPTGWGFIGGTATIIDNPGDPVVMWRLDKDGGPQCRGVCFTLPIVGLGISIRTSIHFFGSDNTAIKALMRIFITTSGGDFYVFNDSGEWSLEADPYNNWYSVPQTPAGQDNDNYVFNITTGPTPVSGQLGFVLSVETLTGSFITFGDVKMQMLSPFSSVNLTGELNDSKQYRKQIELPYGVDPKIPDDIVSVGTISLADGTAAVDWYKYPNTSTDVNMLAQMILQQYMNIFLRNVINFDAEITSLEAVPARVTGMTVLQADDTDPTQISVTGKSFIFGNTTIDPINDWYGGTFLDIGNNSEAEADIETLYFYNDNLS